MVANFMSQFVPILEHDQEVYEYNEDFKKKFKTEVDPCEIPPIDINISSYGGLVESALAIMDLMEQSFAPIHTHALGYCMSSAFALYLKGDIRTAGSNTQFMFHATHGGTQGGIVSQRAILEYGAKLEDMLFEQIREVTKYTQDDINKSRLENRYTGYEEAVKMDVVNYDNFNFQGSLNKTMEVEEANENEDGLQLLFETLCEPQPKKPCRRFIK